MHSCLRWTGSKLNLINEIFDNLPDMSKINTYIEPFLGSGNVMLNMLEKYTFSKIIACDLNKNITNMFNIIKSHPNNLILKLEELQNEYYSLPSLDDKNKLFIQYRELFNNDNSSQIDKVALFIFLNKTCFNGLFRVNSKGMFNTSFGKLQNPKILDKDNIIKISEILNNTNPLILHTSYTDMKEYLSSNAFVYLDPPYKPQSSSMSKFKYTISDFDDNEQRKLASFFKSADLLGCKVMLSNSYSDYILNLYASYNTKVIYRQGTMNSNVSKRQPVPEVLITNY